MALLFFIDANTDEGLKSFWGWTWTGDGWSRIEASELNWSADERALALAAT